jgi:hypothetical protein
MAVHGRAPNWVYGALAMHAYPQPFHQFDGCIGWVQPRELKVGNPKQQCAEIMTLDDQELRDDVTIVRVHLTYRGPSTKAPVFQPGDEAPFLV